MVSTLLKPNINIKSQSEFINPPVHALWKFLEKVAEFDSLAQYLLYGETARYCRNFETQKK